MLKLKKEQLTYIIIVLCSVGFLLLANWYISADYSYVLGRTDYGAQRAVITKIVERTTAATKIEGVSGEEIMIIFEAEIKSGLAKGETVLASQTQTPFSPLSLREVKKGDSIILLENLDLESDIDWHFGEYVRIDKVWWLTAIFMVGLLIFGRMKGVSTIISLILTCGAIFGVFIPSVLSGLNIYSWSMIICVYIIVMTLLVINGVNTKSLAAALGCSGGVVVTGILTHVMSRLLDLTGMVDEDSMYLLYVNPENPVDLKAIIFAAIIIGAVGAIMDVAMSLASALYELSTAVENPTPKLLITSGFTIGKDMMGTMANTLVLAYIGSSLSVTLLMVAYSSSFTALLNNEMIVVEMLQAVVGSFGILFAIPITTFICAMLYSKKQPVPTPIAQEETPPSPQ